MNLKPHICPQCGAPIDLAKMRCDYCGTQYQNENLRTLTIRQVRPGEHKIAAEVRLSRDHMLDNPEGARDYALRHLRNQIAEGLLGYMKIRTCKDFSPDYMARTEIIRAEVRVLDPMFEDY